MQFLRPLSLLPLLLLTACAAHSSTTAPAPLPTAQFLIALRPFTLEIAADDEAREIGLMNRTTMAADHGMIFLFPNSGIYKFWMKDTKIPLDLLYLDNAGRIVHIVTLQPGDLVGFQNYVPAMYVIEVNAGTAQALGLKVGESIPIPAGLPAAR